MPLNTKRLCATVCVALAMSASPLLASDSTLSRALGKHDYGQPWVFAVSFESDHMNSELTIDPSQPAGQRVAVSTPPQEDWSTDFAMQLSEFDESAGDIIWCSDFAKNIPSNATLVSSTATTQTYEFVPVPDDEDDAQFLPHLEGSVTISTDDPAILKFSMIAPRSFKPMWLARIKRFEMIANCARLDDGRTHVETMDINIDGTIAMQQMGQRESWRVTLLHPVN